MDILIEGLSKSYGTEKAVDNISFEVRTGEIVGFLGPNGAGKTTTMKMITQYLTPDSGQITIGGKPTSQNNLRGSIGYLPEHNPLYDEMPVIDYLEFCGQLQGIPKNQVAQRIREMVLMCGLNDEKHKKINELSKGFKQRVGLAQAMIHDPAILILDEPTANLDPVTEKQVLDTFFKIMHNKTTLLITHRLVGLENMDEIMVLEYGRIKERGTHHELLRKGGLYQRLWDLQNQILVDEINM